MNNMRCRLCSDIRIGLTLAVLLGAAVFPVTAWHRNALAQEETSADESDTPTKDEAPATDDALGSELTAQALEVIRRFESGEATAAELQEARKILERVPGLLGVKTDVPENGTEEPENGTDEPEGPGEEEEEKEKCKFVETSEYCPDVACCMPRDACILLSLPGQRPDPVFTPNGVFALDSLFMAAAARGVENATIRAMNATRVCPTCKQKDCEHLNGAASESPDG